VNSPIVFCRGISSHGAEKKNGGGGESAAEVKEAAIVTAVETPVIVVDGGAVEVDEDITMNTAFDNEREATASVAEDII
jgi:hypothetical protein